jgi:hypothetical protein
MSLFKEFTILFPYLQSVRKLKTYLSFDIEFPESWKLPKKYVNEEKVVENEKSKQGFRFFSFVSEFDEKSVDEIISNIKNIIAYNKEREEKERLFQLKVDELKKMFEKEKLGNLQALKFEITEEKIELDDSEETIKPAGGNATVA